MTLKNYDIEKSLWGWRWPLIGIVAIGGLFGIQMLRVNQPRPATNPQREVYSTPGPLVAGEIFIAERSFHSTRINLNRRAKIHGTWRTNNLKSHVDVLVMDDVNFENWKLGRDYESIVHTGYVPGGRITPVLNPGIYHLIFDNRHDGIAQSVHTDIVLE